VSLPDKDCDAINLDTQWHDSRSISDGFEAATDLPQRRPLPDFRRHERRFLKRLMILTLASAGYFLSGWWILSADSVGNWLLPTLAETQDAGVENCNRYAGDIVATVTSESPELPTLNGGGKREICAWRRHLADMLGDPASRSHVEISALDVAPAEFPWAEVEVRLSRRLLARLADGRTVALVTDEALTARRGLFGLEISRIKVHSRLDPR